MKKVGEITTYELIRKNRDSGVEVLYERYGKRLYSYGVNSWKLSEDESWEMVYQSLYKMVEKIDQYEFNTEKKFSSFLFTVFCNFLRRHYRDSKRIEEELSFTSFNESNFEESHGNSGMYAERKVQTKLTERAMETYHSSDTPPNIYMMCLEEALDELEPWQRILVLQRSQNMPYNEIARFVDKPANQLKVYFGRIQKKLATLAKNKLEEYNTKANEA